MLILSLTQKEHQDVVSKIDGRLFLGMKVTEKLKTIIQNEKTERKGRRRKRKLKVGPINQIPCLSQRTEIDLF